MPAESRSTTETYNNKSDTFNDTLLRQNRSMKNLPKGTRSYSTIKVLHSISWRSLRHTGPSNENKDLPAIPRLPSNPLNWNLSSVGREDSHNANMDRESEDASTTTSTSSAFVANHATVSSVDQHDVGTINPVQQPKKDVHFNRDFFSHEAKKAMCYLRYLERTREEEIKQRVLEDLKAKADIAATMTMRAKEEDFACCQEVAQKYSQILKDITSTSAAVVKEQTMSKQNAKAQRATARSNEVANMSPNEIKIWLRKNDISEYLTEDRYELKLVDERAVLIMTGTDLHRPRRRLEASTFINSAKMSNVLSGEDSKPRAPEILIKRHFELAKKIIVANLGNVPQRDANKIKHHYEEAFRAGFPWPKDSGVEATLVRLEQRKITQYPFREKLPGKFLGIPISERYGGKVMQR